MEKNEVYITITHINAFGGPANFRIGDILTLRKEHENLYDDEAILAYGRHNAKCGYVANSVTTVARGHIQQADSMTGLMKRSDAR